MTKWFACFMLLFAATCLAAPVADPQAPSYQQGSHDRDRWAGWYSNISGDFKEGATYWSSQRSLKQPTLCHDPTNSLHSLAWLTGCDTAYRFLTPVDYKRHTDPQYWFGWNKAQPPSPVVTVTSTGGYRIGPSYDCAKISRALEQFICFDSDLSKLDLSFVRIYYALRWQVGADGWQDLKIEAAQYQNAMMAVCDIDANGAILPDDRADLKR